MRSSHRRIPSLSCPGRLRPALRWAAVATAALWLAAAPASHAATDTKPAAAPSTTAATEGAVRVKLTQVRVETQADGKEKLVDVQSVKPGDVVEYRAVYTNTSKEAVRDLVASLPMPDGLEYVAKSARGSDGLPVPQVSTRDGKTGTEPLMVTEGGKKVAVPYAQYRVLRWRVGTMAPGGSVTVSARARVPVPSSGGASPQAAPQR